MSGGMCEQPGAGLPLSGPPWLTLSNLPPVNPRPHPAPHGSALRAAHSSGCGHSAPAAPRPRSARWGPASSCGPAQLTWSSTSLGLIHSLLPLLLSLLQAAQCCLQLWLKSSRGPSSCCAAPAFPSQTSEETCQPTLRLASPPPPVPSGHHGPLGAGPCGAPLTPLAPLFWNLHPCLSPSLPGLSTGFLLQPVSGLPVTRRTQPGALWSLSIVLSRAPGT